MFSATPFKTLLISQESRCLVSQPGLQNALTPEEPQKLNQPCLKFRPWTEQVFANCILLSSSKVVSLRIEQVSEMYQGPKSVEAGAMS